MGERSESHEGVASGRCGQNSAQFPSIESACIQLECCCVLNPEGTQNMNQYFVVDMATGQKYGPADLATLNQWALEGRVTAQTQLEDAATGARVMGADVPGLNVPKPVTQMPSNPPSYQAPSAPGAFSNQSSGGGAPYPRGPMGGPIDNSPSETNKVYAFIVLTLCCCWPIFGYLAIKGADKEIARGNPSGSTLKTVAIIVTVISALLSVVNVIMRVSQGGLGR